MSFHHSCYGVTALTSMGKEKKKEYSKMDLLRLMKDAQYAEKSGHHHRALHLVNRAFSLLVDLHPQISGEGNLCWF